jgi:hypothetical protein
VVGVRAVSALFDVNLDPYAPLTSQATTASVHPGTDPVRLFAYPHLSGIGVEPGFAVSRMGDELETLGRRLSDELRQRRRIGC